MPRLRLPPLPPVAEWRSVFPRSGGHPFGFSTTKGPLDASMAVREAGSRVTLADTALCDKFVRDLGIRENEVVIDTYCGVGQLTRSLLAGGVNQTTPADWDKVKKEQEIVGPAVSKDKKSSVPGEFDYPPWDTQAAPGPRFQQSLIAKAAKGEIVTPKLVVASDSHFTSLCRGLGLLPTIPGDPVQTNWPRKKDSKEEAADSIRRRDYLRDRGMFPSLLEDRLVFSSQSVYFWPTMTNILSDPLVNPSLEVYDKTKTGVEATYRPWNAPPPPITFLATPPTSVLGDQMISQWISSAIGSDEYGRSWLWKWGRVRMAMLVHKGLYDRIMARPGETIHCKLSVMAHALFHVRPLPPYHHVPDVDKQSTRTNTELVVLPTSGKTRGRAVRNKPTFPAVPPTNEVTHTRLLDFYTWGGLPVSKEKALENAPLERPLLLGIEFIPRADSPVKVEQREVWDFVLRKCFVRETNEIAAAVPKLAFGADNLVPRFAEGEGSRYAGNPVPPNTTVRDLTVEQWHRVVDVFDKWAFKPDNLLVDLPVLEESREIGMSM